MQRRLPLVQIILLLIGIVLVVWYVVQTQGQLRQLKTSEKEYVQRIEKLSKVNRTAPFKINETFIDKFFNYQSTKQRYVGVKPLMSELGYRSIFPIGMEVPSSDESVKSQLAELKSYEYPVSANRSEFFNEFKLTTIFNENKTEQTVIVRTILIQDPKRGWIIDDFEFIGQLTG